MVTSLLPTLSQQPWAQVPTALADACHPGRNTRAGPIQTPAQTHSPSPAKGTSSDGDVGVRGSVSWTGWGTMRTLSCCGRCGSQGGRACLKADLTPSPGLLGPSAQVAVHYSLPLQQTKATRHQNPDQDDHINGQWRDSHLHGQPESLLQGPALPADLEAQHHTSQNPASRFVTTDQLSLKFTWRQKTVTATQHGEN